jgi:hypothetical protein
MGNDIEGLAVRGVGGQALAITRDGDRSIGLILFKNKV